jgi:hypothetical protein
MSALLAIVLAAVSIMETLVVLDPNALIGIAPLV